MAHENEAAILALYSDVVVVTPDGKAWITSGIEKTVDVNAVALKKVQLARAAAYQPLQEQFDQLYHDIDAGKFGADAKTGSWFVGISSVKTAHPKS